MQYWTKTKPNRPGYWWAKDLDGILDEDGISIEQIVFIENVLYTYYYGELYILEHKLFNNYHFFYFFFNQSVKLGI